MGSAGQEKGSGSNIHPHRMAIHLSGVEMSMKRFFLASLTAMNYVKSIKGGVPGILDSVVGGIRSLARGASALIRVPTVFITSTGELVGNAVEIQALLNNKDAMACITQMMGEVKLQEKKENIASELRGKAMNTGVGGSNRIFVPDAIAEKHDRSILKPGYFWYRCSRCHTDQQKRNPKTTCKACGQHQTLVRVDEQ